MNIVDVAEMMFPGGVLGKKPESCAGNARVERLPWDLVTGFAPPKLRKCKHCEKRMSGGELWGHGLSAHAGKFKGFKRWLYAVEAKEASWAGVVSEGMRFRLDI